MKTWRNATRVRLMDHELRQGSSARFRPPILEASGLCPVSESKSIDDNLGIHESVPNLFWTHNDSFDRARAFQVKLNGELIHEIAIPGIDNVDWEACSSAKFDPHDGADVLYIADTGNNFHWRDQLVIYALGLSQDDQGHHTLKPLRPYHFRFPRNGSDPPLSYEKDDGRCLDIESLFWRHGELFMISKCAISSSPTLWRLPREKDGGRSVESQIVLEDLGKLSIVPSAHPLLERVTDASYLAREGILAVLTYQSLWFYQLSGDPKRPKLSPPLTRCDLNIKGRNVSQAEALSWVESSEGNQLVVLTELGDVYTYKIDIPTNHRLTCVP